MEARDQKRYSDCLLIKEIVMKVTLSMKSFAENTGNWYVYHLLIVKGFHFISIILNLNSVRAHEAYINQSHLRCSWSQTYKWLKKNLKSKCSFFFFFNGCISLYINDTWVELLLKCKIHGVLLMSPCLSFQRCSLTFHFSSVISASLRPHGLQNTRLPCPSPTPGAYSNSCPSTQWCHPTILSSVAPISSCLQSVPASGSFQMSQFFTSGGQSIGASVSASVLPMNIQDWFRLDVLAVQGTLRSLYQHYSSKASVLQCSAFFIVHLSHPNLTTGKP